MLCRLLAALIRIDWRAPWDDPLQPAYWWPTLMDADPQRVRGAVAVATAVIAGADPLDAAIATGTSAAKATAATSVLVAAAQAGAEATQPPTEGDTPT